MLKVFAF